MKKAAKSIAVEPMEAYDFRGGVRGKYARRFAAGSNVVVLEPDVAKVYRALGTFIVNHVVTDNGGLRDACGVTLTIVP